MAHWHKENENFQFSELNNPESKEDISETTTRYGGTSNGVHGSEILDVYQGTVYCKKFCA